METADIKELLLWAFLIISVVLNVFYLILTYKESYRKSFEDPLTKLNNRKFLDEILKMIEIGGDTYDAIFCDIDHFKRVNDTYGHDVGDDVLRITGQKLKSNFKSTKDHIVRYGGEEFIIFLYRKDKKDNKEAIIKRIEELRKAVEENILTINDNEIKFTMSFGISFYDKKISFGDQIKRADEALYYSKDNGRNMVTNREDI